MSKASKRNTEALQIFYNNKRNRIPQATRTKVQNIINLYSGRKIAQFITADNLIRNVATTPWVENLTRRRIFRDQKPDTKTFHRLKLLLMTDDSFKADVGHAEGYIACIKVNYAERVDNADAFKPQDEDLTNTKNASMYHRYIQTPLDPQYETLKEAIKVEHYVKNKCWFNTLTDYFKDILMGDHKREKNKLTKEAVLKNHK